MVYLHKRHVDIKSKREESQPKSEMKQTNNIFLYPNLGSCSRCPYKINECLDSVAKDRQIDAFTLVGAYIQEELKWEPDDGMKTGNDYRKLGGKMFARQYVYNAGPVVGPKI